MQDRSQEFFTTAREGKLPSNIVLTPGEHNEINGLALRNKCLSRQNQNRLFKMPIN